MNIKKLLILAPVAVLSLTSCGKTGVRHDTKDYFVKTKHVDFSSTGQLKILQLSDLHLGTNCDRKVQYAFIQETIDQAKRESGKIDLIVITGDVFTFGTKEIAQDFCSFMEKQQIDWTLTFGNHDEQCYFSVDWLTGYLNQLSAKEDSYLLFKDNQDDDVFGNANFVISIEDKDTHVEEKRLYIFDSNRYRYQIGSYGYDYIHHDQIDWYDRCARYNFNGNDPTNVESLAFFHIPFEEFDTYYKYAKDNVEQHAKFLKDGTEELKTQNEGVSCPKENTHLFDKFVELKTNEGVFVGHDHINNSAIVTRDKVNSDMVLSFGVKGTDTVYADDNLIGGQVITFGNSSGTRSEDPSLDISIHRILHKYKDLEVK